MSRFERFMEARGLLTLQLSRSDSWWRRWVGILLGALAVCLMLPIIWAWLLFGQKPE